MREWCWVACSVVLAALGCATSEPFAREPGWPSEQLEAKPPVRSPVSTTAPTSPSRPPMTERDEPRIAIVDHGSARNAPPPTSTSNAAFPDEAPAPPIAAAAPSTSSVPPPTGGNVSNAAQVVAAMRPDFRACYQQHLGRDATYQGSLRLTMRIGANGRVTEVDVTPRESPTELVDCVARRARMSVFSPPEGGSAVVAVPVTFVKQ